MEVSTIIMRFTRGHGDRTTHVASPQSCLHNNWGETIIASTIIMFTYLYSDRYSTVIHSVVYITTETDIVQISKRSAPDECRVSVCYGGSDMDKVWGKWWMVKKLVNHPGVYLHQIADFYNTFHYISVCTTPNISTTGTSIWCLLWLAMTTLFSVNSMSHPQPFPRIQPAR